MGISTIFKQVLGLMLERGEFEKIIKNRDLCIEERKRAKHDKMLVKDHYDFFNGDLTKASFIAVLHEIKSVEVLKDVICLMVEMGVNA